MQILGIVDNWADLVCQHFDNLKTVPKDMTEMNFLFSFVLIICKTFIFIHLYRKKRKNVIFNICSIKMAVFYFPLISKTLQTRMHSSRMRTARSLGASRGIHRGGVHTGGAYMLRGHACLRVCMPCTLPLCTEWQTCVKTLPLRKLRLRAVKTISDSNHNYWSLLETTTFYKNQIFNICNFILMC